MQSIANSVDPQMDARVRDAFMHLDIIGLVDDSVLVGDPNAFGIWRSAANSNDCTEMLRLGYAPHLMDKWFRENLTY
jgi:hypothetical protein